MSVSGNRASHSDRDAFGERTHARTHTIGDSMVRSPLLLHSSCSGTLLIGYNRPESRRERLVVHAFCVTHPPLRRRLSQLSKSNRHGRALRFWKTHIKSSAILKVYLSVRSFRRALYLFSERLCVRSTREMHRIV